MKTSDFNYILPPELIAQVPLPRRSESRMMVVHRANGTIEHKSIADLPDYLNQGDLLVVNNTKVIPARIFGRKIDTGGKVELLLVEKVEAEQGKDNIPLRSSDSCVPPSNEKSEKLTECAVNEEWIVLCRSGWKPRAGILLSLSDDNIHAEILESYGRGKVRVRFSCNIPLEDILSKHGVPPVPPYIKRDSSESELVGLDRERYQTVYARESGAVAAPTAGLHFSDELFAVLNAHGVKKAEITLHVGPGTFKPVTAKNVEDHVMDSERYMVNDDAACLINDVKKTGGRIIAVGSTSVRTLETLAGLVGEEKSHAKPQSRKDESVIHAGVGRSSLFIREPFGFKIVDVMLTNFHLPESTLLMMISALAGADLIKRAYQEAIREKYRFYSYGDCMLII